MSFFKKQITTSLLLLLGFITSAHADHLMVDKAWSPETAPVARVMAAYMEISNNSKKDTAITAISSPQFKKVEIHSMSHKGGMMVMKKQERLVIQTGKTVSLAPGGYHVMMFNPARWYQSGSNITLNITLDKGHSFKIVVPVKKDDASSSQHEHHNQH